MNNPITDLPSRQAAEKLPLGTLTNNVSTSAASGKTASEGRILAFQRQAAARFLEPSERVGFCLRRPVPGVAEVELKHNPEKRRAFLRNLMRCESVWMCAPCASQITEVRRAELQAVLDLARSLGYRVVMVTLTLQHHAEDKLQALLDALLQAYRFLIKGRAWRDLARSLGLQGYVRALEVTYGSHGWHPHLHALFFFRDAPTGLLDAFSAHLRKSWPSALRHFGHDASWTYGVDVRDTFGAASEYVSKFGHEPRWTAAHELTKLPTKSASPGGMTPNQLLDAFIAGYTAAGELWREYARAFKGRRQLVRKLPPDLALPEKPDAECIDDETPAAVLLASFSLAEWRLILAHDVRAELLQVADSGDVQAVNEFLQTIGIVR